MNPIVRALDLQRRGFERATDLTRKSEALFERPAEMATVDVGETPNEVVYEENKLRLRHYEPRTERQYDVPILVVYALINKPFVLDLQPDRSVVRTLLEEGFDVYLIDWGEPSTLDAHLSLADYVDRYMDNCVDVVRERSGRDAVNLLGYCMGGTMSAMYAGIHPDKVRNLALMAAGLYFDETGGVLERWGSEEHYDPSAVTDTYGNVPATFLDVGFATMDPIDNFVTKYLRLYENLEDEEFVKNFARMERWLSEGIDVAGRTYDQFIEDIYQGNKLARNELRLGEKTVDIRRIDMPVLQIVGEYDNLIPPESSVPFNDVVASDDVSVFEFPTGHIGLSVSKKSHSELWPRVCEWFAARSDVDGAEGGLGDEAGGTENGGDETAQTPDWDAEERSSDEAEGDAPTTEEGRAGEFDELQQIAGIGRSYATRLREFGVGDIAALASADPSELAAGTRIPEERVRRWVEQAREREGTDDE